MTPETVLTLGRQGLEIMLLTAAPMLAVILVIGLVISILQALTQINESTLSFVPKLVFSAMTLVLAGPWMLTTLTDYLQRVLLSIPGVINGQMGF
ncbi:MAG TPA: flagellar biosynthesis protein FliQ [Lautropia sp.]|jgi:flagellar biosynthetic protein FliQ|nr:flagellar biosynthesis protein FliQ [Lautropia sp.]